MVRIIEAAGDEDGEAVREQITEVLYDTPGNLDFILIGILQATDFF